MKRCGDRLSIEECQKTELEIMKAIHSFCVANGLRYLLAYGTLIGAIRHKGFIPWDNDMDIIMPRQDYERLIELCESEPIGEHCYLLHHSTDDRYHYQCARICDDRTVVEPPILREQPQRMGVWVDIFPIDGVPDGFIQRLESSIALPILKSLQRSDNYALGTSSRVNTVAKALLKTFFPGKGNSHQRFLDEFASRVPFGSTRYAGNVTEWEKTYDKLVPVDFDNPILVDFECAQFFAPRRYDELLTEEYGDYMQLPPVEQRQTHDINARWIQ